MNDNINKPMSIVVDEFTSNLTNLVNESMLPPFIIEHIIKGIYFEVKNVAKRQYEIDLEKYNQLKQIQSYDND